MQMHVGGAVQVIDEGISSLLLGFAHRLNLDLGLLGIGWSLSSPDGRDCNVDGSITR